MMECEFFSSAHVDGVLALCQALEWPSYSADPSVTERALSAPGSTTVVARDGTTIVGLAQIMGDGVVQAHLSLVGVLPSYRRRGVARRLVSEAFRSAGGKWLDLQAEPGSEPFYRSFVHQESVGFRVYPTEDPADPPRG